FKLFEQRLFFGEIFRADRRRALERHVLEHVRQARESLRVLSRAGVNKDLEREHWRLDSAHHDHGQTIRQRAQGDAFLKRSKILRGARDRYRQCCDKQKKRTFHCGPPHESENSSSYGWAARKVESRNECQMSKTRYGRPASMHCNRLSAQLYTGMPPVVLPS